MNGYATARWTARSASAFGLMTTTALIGIATPAAASQLTSSRLAAPASHVHQTGFRRAVGTAIAVGAVKRHFRKKDDKDRSEDDLSENEVPSTSSSPSSSYGMAAPADPGAPGPETGNAALSDEERAQAVLAAEGSNVVKLHPLQAAAPDYNIVVCEAGCGSQGPHVVYKVAKTRVRSVALNAKLNDQPVTRNADCEGGCGNGAGTATAGKSPGLLSPGAADWLTAPTIAKPTAPSTQAPAPPATPMAASARSANLAATPAEAEMTPFTPAPVTSPSPTGPVSALPAEPMTMRPPRSPTAQPLAAMPQDTPAVIDASPASEAAKPATTGSREDWLARINRERAASKSAPALEAPVAPRG